jgi:hypothetical protein
MRNQGYADIRDIPDNYPLNDRQIMVRDVTRSGKSILLEAAKQAVRSLPYPRYYIDFETIQFAVPEWKGTRPYEQIPFQWSCHVEAAGGSLTHYEFLSDLDGDPSRSFSETLLDCVRGDTPVIVYNATFEKTRLQECAAKFPDLAPALLAIRERIFDLLPVARQNYYHPSMHGSWSIKKVLPTVAPDLDYSNLEVSDGGKAQIAFLNMLKLEKDSAERTFVRNNLLAYCGRDTYAMVRLARFFAGE